MQFFEVVKQRRSVRRYLPDEISKETIEKILDAGRWAPSGRNVQPWEFLVIQDSEMRRKIADITDYGKFIADAPVLIIVYCKDTKYYIEDGSAAVENMLLAATDLGLGSCWVAGDKKPYCGTVNKLMGTPEGLRLVAFISVGKSAQVPKTPERKPLNQVVHWAGF